MHYQRQSDRWLFAGACCFGEEIREEFGGWAA